MGYVGGDGYIQGDGLRYGVPQPGEAVSALKDPLGAWRQAEPCWCGSREAYGKCHGIREQDSKPGAPVPEDDSERIWLSPTRTMSPELRAHLSRQLVGMAIEVPAAITREGVTNLDVALAKARPVADPHDLAVLGAMQIEVLRSLGLGDRDRLDPRIRQLSQSDLADLRYGVVDLAKLRIDRLLLQTRLDPAPTVLWNSNADETLSTIASTMLWADHYLTEDELLNALMDEQPLLPALAAAIDYLLENAPLLETGLLVPIPVAAARVLAESDIQSAMAEDRRNQGLVRWIHQQVRLLEGPTARQGLFFGARDYDGMEQFFLKADFIEGTGVDLPSGDGEILSRILGPFDPHADYGRWIQQSRRSVALGLLSEVNTDLAIASAFGGRVVARSPFQGRLLRRKGALVVDGAQALSWAKVPAVMAEEARALARVVREHDAVEALRSRVRSSILEAGEFTPRQGALLASECVAELREEAKRLRGKMARDRLFQLAGAAVGLLSFALGPPVAGALASITGSGLSFGNYRINQAERRKTAAYALMLGGAPKPRRAQPDPGKPWSYQRMRIHHNTVIPW